MKRLPLLPLLALCALALSATAAPEPTKISSSSIASFHNADDSVNNDWSGGGTGIGNFFDGNTSSGVYIGPNGRAANGCYLLLTFGQNYYITAINASSATTHKYSLYYSTDGSTWSAIEGGTEVSKAGTTELSPNVEASYIKCVFDQVGGWTQTFSELEVWGYVPPKPVKISSSSIASFHNADDTVNGDWSGGGTGIGNFFDGNTSSGVYIGPNGRAANGCYLLLTFGQNYYITAINASSATTHKYSLYYSTDGSTWSAIEGGTQVSKAGTTELAPNVTASYIKCIFDQVGGWTQTFSELEVWGMDPADITCTHPSYTEWTPVAGSATCTGYGVDERFCTVCNERYTRESTTLLPLGHDYVHTVTQLGTVSEFGAGLISCSRCEFCIDCSSPFNLVGGTDTNGTKICAVHMDGLHYFAELTVSSTGDTGYGQSPSKLIDNDWSLNESWGSYWYGAQAGSGRDYIQFEFDETIDLAKIEISVYNRDHDIVFYAYDADDDAETEIQRLSVTYDENETKLVKKTVYFFGDANNPGYALKAFRVRSDNDGNNRLGVGEIHPFITARGAGRLGQGNSMFILMQ